MKREKILFYLTSDIVHVYFVNTKREVIENTITSSFFKFGEISNVSNGSMVLEEINNKYNVNSGLLKPIMYVLYNDVNNSDQEYLYKVILESFNYDEIYFFKLSEFIKYICDKDNVVVFDKDYYTLIKSMEKHKNIGDIDYEPILIGKKSNKYKYYSDMDIIWHSFVKFISQ